MAEITLKQLEKLLDKKFDEKLKPFATKKDLDNMQAVLRKDIKESQEELARRVSGGFDHTYERLDEISTKLDVRVRVDMLERKIQKIESALHIKL